MQVYLYSHEIIEHEASSVDCETGWGLTVDTFHYKLPTVNLSLNWQKNVIECVNCQLVPWSTVDCVMEVSKVNLSPKSVNCQPVPWSTVEYIMGSVNCQLSTCPLVDSRLCYGKCRPVPWSTLDILWKVSTVNHWPVPWSTLEHECGNIIDYLFILFFLIYLLLGMTTSISVLNHGSWLITHY